MASVLFAAISIGSLLLSVATLILVVLALQSSRRSEEIGEDRLELLRDQQNRLELMREERKMLSKELERERQMRLEVQQELERLEISQQEEKHDLLPALPSASVVNGLASPRPWWRRILRR